MIHQFQDVIERVEQVRKGLGLNKSQFSSRIGMKPQSYNNFTGAQSTKPSIELIMGVVTKYSVDPLWLLTGRDGLGGGGDEPVHVVGYFSQPPDEQIEREAMSEQPTEQELARGQFRIEHLQNLKDNIKRELPLGTFPVSYTLIPSVLSDLDDAIGKLQREGESDDNQS